MIDLDKSREQMELDTDDYWLSHKVHGPILKYSTEDVKNKRLIEMHVRSSSVK